jgi:hypothetical protein
MVAEKGEAVVIAAESIRKIRASVSRGLPVTCYSG